MKDKIITIRIDEVTLSMLEDLEEWIYSEMKIYPSKAEIIRAAIENMHYEKAFSSKSNL